MRETPFPRVADSADARRDHIAQGAARMIASAGLEALTLRSLADNVGCSKGLIEHYFRNKTGLVNAAAVWVNEQAIARITREMADKTGLQALEVRLRHILPFTDTILDEWRVRLVFLRKFSVTDVHAGGDAVPFEAIFAAILEDLVTARRAAEMPAELDPQAMAEWVLFNVTGIACLCLSDRRLRSRESLGERVAMILAMLRSGSLADVQFSGPDVY